MILNYSPPNSQSIVWTFESWQPEAEPGPSNARKLKKIQLKKSDTQSKKLNTSRQKRKTEFERMQKVASLIRENSSAPITKPTIKSEAPQKPVPVSSCNTKHAEIKKCNTVKERMAISNFLIPSEPRNARQFH